MKRETIKFRCSRYEKKLLKKRAARAGITLSEFCRRSTLGKRVIERITPEQVEHYKMLVQYQVNFKRIGNMFRTRAPYLSLEVEKLANEIREHLFNFKR